MADLEWTCPVQAGTCGRLWLAWPGLAAGVVLGFYNEHTLLAILLGL